MTDLTLIYGAVDRVDCAITALSAVMMGLDDDPEREDRTEVAAIGGYTACCVTKRTTSAATWSCWTRG